MVTQVINGVRFANFPLIISDKGTIQYPLTSMAIAEEVAKGIEEYAKPVVTVDFSRINHTAIMRRMDGDQEPSNPNAEQELLALWNRMDGVSENE